MTPSRRGPARALWTGPSYEEDHRGQMLTRSGWGAPSRVPRGRRRAIVRRRRPGADLVRASSREVSDGSELSKRSVGEASGGGGAGGGGARRHGVRLQ